MTLGGANNFRRATMGFAGMALNLMTSSGSW
jgi:hypothetical protein